MTEHEVRSAWLVTAQSVVERLGLPAQNQLNYLKKLGVDGSADELGLEFDDVWLALRPLLDASKDEELLSALTALDEALSVDSLWDPRSLERSETWQEVRRLAQRASRAIGLQLQDR